MAHGRLWGGVALAALLTATGAMAQDNTAALEARIAQLEAELGELKAAVRENQAQNDAVRAQVQAQATAPAPVNDGVLRLPQSQTAAPAPVATASAAPQRGFRAGDLTLNFGGFIKADTKITRYGDGNPASGDTLRDFYVPGSIPVGGDSESTQTDFSARQTRFWLTADGDVGGHKVGAHIEMDFQGLPGSGDERTTNPSNPSLRRAFMTIDNWLIGQEWSTFQNSNTLPETADYVGPVEGAVVVRQPQIRYTRGPFAIAVENPETTITPFGGGTRIVADDNAVPDIVARYLISRPWGEFQMSGLVRQLRHENPALNIEDSATGWGLSATGKIKVGAEDDIRFVVSGGEGIGRYLGLNLANDAVLSANGDLETIGVLSGYAGYRHVWAPGWRSSLIAAHQAIDNPTALTGLGVTKSATSLRGNLIYTPLTGLDIGAELMFGERKLENDLSGDMTRLILFAKYGF